MMAVAGSTFQTDKVFVGIFLIAGFGYGIRSLLNRLERRSLDSWRYSPPGQEGWMRR